MIRVSSSLFRGPPRVPTFHPSPRSLPAGSNSLGGLCLLCSAHVPGLLKPDPEGDNGPHRAPLPLLAPPLNGGLNLGLAGMGHAGGGLGLGLGPGAFYGCVGGAGVLAEGCLMMRRIGAGGLRRVGVIVMFLVQGVGMGPGRVLSRAKGQTCRLGPGG
jgi:hypothetical protein